MFKKFLYVLFWTSLALSLKAHSATYYISSSGNDANDGSTESTPWQTIDKINSFTFADNDTIFFKRGEVFRGAIKFLKFPVGITIGAYGTGDNPVISGSVEITGWTKTTHPALDNSVVYEADVSGLPLTTEGIHHLFVDGQLMTIARYPNVDSPDQTNWLQVGAIAGSDGFTDPALVVYGKPDGYWVGSTLRIRSYSWTYKVTEVTGYTASDGKITADRLSNQLAEWGYFLDDKLEELDHPGEWYYDVNTQTVYLYPKGGVEPNTALIEGSTYDVGISISNGQDNTLIENLTFRHFTQEGVYISNSSNCVVRNNFFEYNLKGFATWNPANVLITGNTFNHQFNKAIGLSASSSFDVLDSIVEKNTITNTALYPLYGERYDGIYQGIGISVFGKAYTVRQNTIENSSHAGIELRGDGHHLIENNVVRHAMLLLNDGGAIVIGSDGNQILGNFFFDSVGNVDESNGCANNTTPCPHHNSYGMGIGANNTLKDNVIEGNTVANNAHEGIRLNSFTNSTVRNNTIYNNQKNQIVVEDIYGSKISNNNVVEDNIIYPLSSEQNGLKLTNMTDHGTFDNNYYCNPYSEIVLIRDKKRYGLAHWQSIFPPYEQNSKWCGITFSEYSVSNVGTNLIQNSTFDADVSNWNDSGASVITHDTTQAQMDGGSLKAVYSGTGDARVIPKSFALTTGQYYRLKFSVVGNGFGTIQLRINNTDPSNRAILKESFFAYEPNRQEHEMFFQSPVTTSSGKILLFTTQDDADTYWLDNVTFEPVTVTLNDATQQSPLFTNTTALPKTISLGSTTYYDLDGNPVTGSITLDPFSSQILTTSAPPPPPPVTMTISHLGNGSGTVTAPVGVGSGINCGSTCTETYAYGTPITLTATPNAGSIFTGWTGTGCSENVTITTHMSCTANFALSNYMLTLNKAGTGNGTINSVGISCGTDCTESYVNGTAVSLAVIPDANSTFTGWTGTGCAGNFAITADMNCTANFALSNYTLTVSKAGTGSGTVSSTGINCGVDCSESYVSGTAVTLTTTPTANSTFTGWTGTGCAGNFAITSDMSCTANFALLNHTLTVNKAGTGSGTVSSTGIDCGADCSESYVSGTAVTLTATQAADSIFTGWTGTGCAGNFAITADMNCTANFALSNYTLTVNKAGTGSGTVSSTGIDCGTDCSESYISGTAVTLTATPAADSIFTGWTGTNCADSVTISADMNCTATFDLIPVSPVNYTLTVLKAGTGSGTVSSTGIDCGLDCSESYVNGSAVTLTATPAADSIFTGWTGTNCADSFNITTDMNCTATFDLIPVSPVNYTLTVIKAGTGSGTVSSTGIDCGADCSESYISGTAVTLTATQAADSIFTGWTGTNCADSVTISADMNCTATFDLIPASPVNYTLTVLKAGTGSGTVSSTGIDCGLDCSESYVNGTAITLTATQAADSIFTGWTGTNCADSVTISADMNCTATFDLIPASPVNYSLTVNKAGTGSGTVSSTGIDCGLDCSESYVSGSAINLTATPTADSIFTGWTGTNCADSFNITADMNCTATFDLMPASPVNYTLTVIKAGTGNGTVSSTGIDCGADCSESYISGTAVTLTATQAADSIFTGWTGTNCANSFNITADMNCTATFDLMPVSQPLPSYALMVNTVGRGEIISNPTGIACGTDCIRYYVSGTIITLTAMPDSGMNFTGWTGACSGSNDSFDITMDNEKTCTAQFEPIEISPIPDTSVTYPLTITTIGEGIITSEPAGITCGENCSANYTADTIVTLSVNLLEGNVQFIGFTGDADCVDGAITMNQPVNCVATFETFDASTEIPNDNLGENTTDNGTNTPVDGNGENTTDNGTNTPVNNNDNSELPPTPGNYRLTMTTMGNGIVNSEPVGITCGEECIEDYPKDTVVAFTATLLDDNTQFIGFSGDADCSDGLVTMNQSLDCIAIFEPITVISDEVTETASDIVESDNELPIVPVALPMNYFLTITRIGNGYVSSEPADILCGNDCIANYPSDTVVNLTIGLEANTQFLGFTGDPDCSDGVITLTKPTHCIATFHALNPGYIQFAAAEYNINEDAEQLIVTVKRLGGIEGTVIVNYATQDNSAIAGHDYVETWGTLKWEDGDQSDRIFSIPLLDNEENDGDKTFTLALFGFSGNQVTVTIWDNEIPVTEPVEEIVSSDNQTCPTNDLVEEVCDAQGQTLSNLRIAQAGQLDNVVLEGNVINNGWISNATIQADTTLSGGIVSGEITNEGILKNVEFRGTRIKGGTLTGIITNTQNGTIEDVLLAAQTQISGGNVGPGNIQGDATGPAQLNNLIVQAGTTLSHVIIGDNVQMSSDVSLGRGVRFANRQPIPTELELITVLPALPQLTCAEPGTMPEAVDLHADVWQPGDDILSYINELPFLLDNGWEITQNDSGGYLQLTIAEWHYAVQPMSIKYSTAPANLQVQDNQSTRFLIDGGLDILTQPAIQAPCDLIVALENMGLSHLIGQTNGNLKIPASNNSWYSARPDFASVALTTDTVPGLYLSKSPIVSQGLVATLVFDQKGLRRQQTFYSTLAVPEALYASAQEIVIEPYGLVNFKLDGQSYRGVVDYLVTLSNLPVPEKVQIIPLSDINQDGTADFALLYPTGEQQTVFAMP